VFILARGEAQTLNDEMPAYLTTFERRDSGMMEALLVLAV